MSWDDDLERGATADEQSRPREAFAVERIGDYRLIQRLGEGGMGVVHLALDRSGRAVAIKVLRPHVAEDAAARVRLAREVETLRRIRSEHVAPIVDADVRATRPYLVTRYIPGRTLDEVVGEGGPLPPSELHRLAAGLAEALTAIHAVGVVHRDLKPTNILLQDGEPVLIDFGIAHLTGDHRLTATGLVMGTPGYLAPELIDGGDVTPATDWWGWAATVTYAAAGAPPFGRGAMDAVIARVMRGEPTLEAVDPRIAPLLYAALSPRAQDRPAPREIIAALDRYAQGAPVTEVIGVRAAPETEPVAVPAVQRWRQIPPTAVQEVVPRPAERRAPAAVPTMPPPYVPPPAPVAVPQALPQSLPLAPTGRQPEYYGDPRIGLPNRSGVLAALLTWVAAFAAVAPVVAVLVIGGVMVLARTVDYTITSRVVRRHIRGERAEGRSELARAVLVSPWHLLVAAGSSALAMLLPVLVGGSAVLASALVLSGVGWPDQVRTMSALAVGGGAAAVTAWWGPAGVAFRRGGRSVVRGLTASESSEQVVIAVVLVAAAGMLAWGWTRGETTWAPLSGIPDIFSGALGGS